MVSNAMFMPDVPHAVPPPEQRLLLHRLIEAACTALGSQLHAYALGLASALLDGANTAADAREANLQFNAGNLLRKNTYAFQHLAAAAVRSALEQEVELLHRPLARSNQTSTDELRLVPFTEMEQRLMRERVARPQELAHASLLATLNLRMAALLGRADAAPADNPFRPAVLLAAMDAAWREFDPDADSHHLLLQQMQAGLVLDLGSVLQAVDAALLGAGILPRLSNHLPIRKASDHRLTPKNPLLMQQLRALFAAAPASADAPSHSAGSYPAASRYSATPLPASLPAAPVATPPGALPQFLQLPVDPPGQLPISPALSAYLADMQRRGPAGSISTPATRQAYRLSELKQQVPPGAMSPADETTVDVMTRMFEAVFRDPNIAPEMKELIGYLQIPVLKAALLDKEFFFEESHPARRLMRLLTNANLGWGQDQGRTDPLYQAIAENVGRVRQFDTEVTLFADVVANLERFLLDDDQRHTEQLAAPITQALKQEKLREATHAATADVALRVASGDVVAFVEAFLESRWVSVLTLAHSVKEDKPHVLASALKTMDALIWSVQPKISAEQRRELVTKLPGLLNTLNKWLNVVKWDDAERLRFFAELAECHASIVRAPMELSPHRQLELAVEAARLAAERRLAKQAAAPAKTPADPFLEQVEALHRGTWCDFQQDDASLRRVKLAWVSPRKSLYIFTTVHREEAFSLAADALAQIFRDGRVEVVDSDAHVNQALVDILGQSPAQPAAESPLPV